MRGRWPQLHAMELHRPLAGEGGKGTVEGRDNYAGTMLYGEHMGKGGDDEHREMSNGPRVRTCRCRGMRNRIVDRGVTDRCQTITLTLTITLSLTLTLTLTAALIATLTLTNPSLNYSPTDVEL